MRYFVFYIVCLIASFQSAAQNRISHSQYMHNQGIFNPAFSNPEHQLTGTTYLRKQWWGIEGTPFTKSLVAQYRIGPPHVINLNFYQDQITVFKDFRIGAGYAYNLQLSRSSQLSFGINADYGRFTHNFMGLAVQDQGDNVLASSTSGKSYLNFGAGLYYESDRFFAGFSSPYLFNNSLLRASDGLFLPSLKFNHFYATAGYRFDGDYISFTPTVLIKTVSGSPIQADINMNALVQDKIWLSLGYRTNHAVILSTGYVIIDNLKLVYSYDLEVLTRISHAKGSHEISLGYGISFYQNKSFSKRRYYRKRGKPMNTGRNKWR